MVCASADNLFLLKASERESLHLLSTWRGGNDAALEDTVTLLLLLVNSATGMPIYRQNLHTYHTDRDSPSRQHGGEMVQQAGLSRLAAMT